MPRSSDYTIGWIDTSIHEFLAEIDEPSTSMAFALITCLDSSFDVAKIAATNRALHALADNGKIVGKGILVTTRRLLTLERRSRLFFGFDEVWFFSANDVAAKPKNVVITGPNQIEIDAAGMLVKWMKSSGCSLGLGDGTGMNFCAKLQGVAKHLVASFTPATPAASKRRAFA